MCGRSLVAIGFCAAKSLSAAEPCLSPLPSFLKAKLNKCFIRDLFVWAGVCRFKRRGFNGECVTFFAGTNLIVMGRLHKYCPFMASSAASAASNEE